LGNQFSKDLNAAVNYNLGGDGTYQVTMFAKTRDNGCTCSLTKQIVMDRLSVSKVTNSVNVYPNPVKSLLTLTTENSGMIEGVEVINSFGSLIPVPMKKLSVDTYILDFSDLSSGVYFIRYSLEGQWLSTQIAVSH
jgi:hypothetical protein